MGKQKANTLPYALEYDDKISSTPSVHRDILLANALCSGNEINLAVRRTTRTTCLVWIDIHEYQRFWRKRVMTANALRLRPDLLASRLFHGDGKLYNATFGCQLCNTGHAYIP